MVCVASLLPLIYIGGGAGEATPSAPKWPAAALGRLPWPNPPSIFVHGGRKGGLAAFGAPSPSFPPSLVRGQGVEGAHQPLVGCCASPPLAHKAHTLAGGCPEPLPVPR